MSKELLEHGMEMIAGLGRLRSARMFGGHGIYCDELFIALVFGDELYFKTNAGTKGAFEAQGSSAFTYERQGKTAALGFHRVPLDALDSPESMRPWAKLAIQAAVEARKTAKPVAKAGGSKAAKPAKTKAPKASKASKPAAERRGKGKAAP